MVTTIMLVAMVTEELMAYFPAKWGKWKEML